MMLNFFANGIIVVIVIQIRVIIAVKELIIETIINIPITTNTDANNKTPVKEIDIKDPQNLEIVKNKIIEEKIPRDEKTQVDVEEN